MKKYLLAVGLTFFGALSACTPVTYTEVLVDPSPPVVYRTAPSIYVAPTYRPYYGSYYASPHIYRGYHHGYRPFWGHRHHRYYGRF